MPLRLLPSYLAGFLLVLVSIAATSDSLHAQADARAYSKAKTTFRKAIKSDRINERREGISALVQTRHPSAVKDLQTALHKARKNVEKAEKKIDKPRKKFAEVTEELEKRIDKHVEQGGDPQRIPAGLVGNLPDKQKEWFDKLQPLENDLRMENTTRLALLVAIGDLIGSLEEKDKETETNRFIDYTSRLRDTESRLDNLEILGFIRTPQAVLGLVGIALNNDNSEVRIGAIDALAEIGDPRGAEAAMAALDDDFWQVRSTAVRALERIGHVDAIPALITRLGKEDGRLKGDILESLNGMTGQDFQDNVPLWEKWWKEENKTLSDLMKSLEAEMASERIEAMNQLGTAGFLLGVRRQLAANELSESAIRRRQARLRAKPETGKKDQEEASNEAREEEMEAFRSMVGTAISTRKAQVRDRALELLLIEPWSQTDDDVVREELTELIGRTGTKRSSEILRRILRREKNKPDLRRAAVRGLGHCGRDDDAIRVGRLFSESNPERDLLLDATKSLEAMGTTAAVRALIQGLRDIKGEDDLAGVVKAGMDSLKKMTDHSAGTDLAAWVDWWKENKEGFKTAKEKEDVAKNKPKDDEDGRYGFYGIKTFSKRVAYVLDISGSMNEPAEYGGTNRTKIDVAKEELIKAIGALPKDAQFNIIVYSTGFEVWQKKLVTADADGKGKAKAWVSKLTAVGGTNIYDSLERAFQFAGRGTFDKAYKTALDTIFFLSDGQPNQGKITNPVDILRACEKLNRLRKVQIHTVGVGKGHNAGFMRALAKMGEGVYVAR